MKLLAIKNSIMQKHLADISNQELHITLVNNVNEAVFYIQNSPESVIVISDLITINERQHEEIKQLAIQNKIAGIIHVSNQPDEVISVASQTMEMMGIKNLSSIKYPTTNEKMKSVILKACDNFYKEQDLIKKRGGSIFGRIDIRTLSSALTNQMFTPYLQPQLSIKDGTISGFEILARLKINKRIYEPESFISVLIKHHKITKLTLMLLRKTLLTIEEYDEFTGTLSLNVDYQSLIDFNFAKDIIDLLKELNFPSNRLIIELTENAPSINLNLMHNLIYLRTHGCGLSVDDFGTRSSGFTELLKFPFSEIKIDKSFLSKIETPHGYKVIKALCAAAFALDCSIVAEGVETADQLKLITDLNIDRAQGYLYAKPQPIYEAMKSLDKRIIKLHKEA